MCILFQWWIHIKAWPKCQMRRWEVRCHGPWVLDPGLCVLGEDHLCFNRAVLDIGIVNIFLWKLLYRLFSLCLSSCSSRLHNVLLLCFVLPSCSSGMSPGLPCHSVFCLPGFLISSFEFPFRSFYLISMFVYLMSLCQVPMGLSVCVPAFILIVLCVLHIVLIPLLSYPDLLRLSSLVFPHLPNYLVCI